MSDNTASMGNFSYPADDNIAGTAAKPSDNAVDASQTASSSDMNDQDLTTTPAAEPIEPTQGSPAMIDEAANQPQSVDKEVPNYIDSSAPGSAPVGAADVEEAQNDSLDSLLGKLRKFKDSMNESSASATSAGGGASVYSDVHGDGNLPQDEALSRTGVSGEADSMPGVAESAASPSVGEQMAESAPDVKQEMDKEIIEQPVDINEKNPANDATAKVSLTETPVLEEGVTEPVAPPSVQETSNSAEVAVQQETDDSPTIPAFDQKVEQVVNASAGRRYSIHELLQMVIDRDSSDLHIKVGYPAQLRIDGSLQSIGSDIIDEKYAEELVYALLDDAKRDKLEVNREIDFAYAYEDRGRFRVNAFYQRKSLSMALRLIPSRIKSMDELNLPGIYSSLTRLNQGFVLVTGPTGSGKSTTLASMIQDINIRRACHILTIEDPIEYVYPTGKAIVSQREVGDDTHGWDIAMRSALREDPDVILVGEMRDYETIASAITLAETGHLVFATLHTNSASQTVERIIDVFPESQQNQVRTQLSNILEAVIAQRLVPVNGGGRKAVSEIMLANPAIRNLIREGKTHQIDNVIRTSADIGMISIEHSLVQMVRDGQITMENAQKFAVKPEEVIRLLKD